MSEIPTSLARKRAVDRIILVMRSQYATELASVNDADNGGELHLPAPEESSYYRAPPQGPETLVPTNSHVPVYVYPSSDTSVNTRSSGGVQTVGETITWNMEIVIACRASTSKEHTVDGHTVTTGERLWIRSELYLGAMIETVQKYACAGDAIHFVERIGDQPLLMFDQQRRATGIATARYQITQNTRAPKRRSLPEE